MSVLESVTSGLSSEEAKLRVWERLTRALHCRDESNPYSPVLCIMTLLIVGLTIKFGPAIHQLLAQH
jgi:hypothetical protein